MMTSTGGSPPYVGARTYRVVQKKGTVLLGTSLAWPAVAGCSRAETFSQLSAISFAQPCIFAVLGLAGENGKVHFGELILEAVEKDCDDNQSPET